MEKANELVAHAHWNCGIAQAGEAGPQDTRKFLGTAIRTTTTGVLYSVQDASELVGIRANVLLEWISAGEFRNGRDAGRLIPEQYFFTEADIRRLMAAVAASVSSMRKASGPKMLSWAPKPDEVVLAEEFRRRTLLKIAMQ